MLFSDHVHILTPNPWPTSSLLTLFVWNIFKLIPVLMIPAAKDEDSGGDTHVMFEK